MLRAGCRKITVARARGNYLDGFNPPSDVHPGAQTSTFARLSAPSRVVQRCLSVGALNACHVVLYQPHCRPFDASLVHRDRFFFGYARLPTGDARDEAHHDFDSTLSDAARLRGI